MSMYMALYLYVIIATVKSVQSHSLFLTSLFPRQETPLSLSVLCSDYRSGIRYAGFHLPVPAECAWQAVDPETLLHGEGSDLPRTLDTNTQRDSYL